MGVFVFCCQVILMSPCVVEKIVFYSGVHRAHTGTDVYLWATSWQGHDWTHGTCFLSALLLIKTKYDLQKAENGGKSRPTLDMDCTETCTAAEVYSVWLVMHDRDVNRQSGYQSMVTINIIMFSWELNRLRDSINLPVSLLWLFSLATRLTVSLILVLVFPLILLLLNHLTE